VTIGVGHQSHNGITGGGNGQNTATFDTFNFNNGAHNAALFGPAPGGDYTIGGALAIGGTAINDGDSGVSVPNGALTGAAFTFEGGASTGEATGWKISARRFGTTIPTFNTPVNVAAALSGPEQTASLVPAANFRQVGGGASGINADIYLNGNGGSFAANNDFINANAPAGSVVLPDVWWTHPGGGPPNGYPAPGGVGGTVDNGGANDTNVFAEAVQPGAGGPFEGNQDNYGIDMNGEIFIPGDAARGGREWVAFKDGIDDYTYLEVDGNVLIDDNSWTGIESNQNAGGAISLLDTSDAKYDDGEWVSFRMIMWEGGGGDTAALYWDLDGTGLNADNRAGYPADTPILDEFLLQGTTQIGDEFNAASFGGVLPNGNWDEVNFMLLNTGSAFSGTATDVTVVPEPTAPLLIGVSILGLALRRRRR